MLEKIAIAVGVVIVTECAIKAIYLYWFPEGEENFKHATKAEDLDKEDEKISVQAKFSRSFETRKEDKQEFSIVGKPAHSTIPIITYDSNMRYSTSYRTVYGNDISSKINTITIEKIEHDTGLPSNLGNDFISYVTPKKLFDSESDALANVKEPFNSRERFEKDFDVIASKKEYNEKTRKMKYTYNVDKLVYLSGRVHNQKFICTKINLRPFLFNTTYENLFWYGILDLAIRCIIYGGLIIFQKKTLGIYAT